MRRSLDPNVHIRSSRSIGQVAQECGVGVHLLRQWEDAGLLTPTRVHGQRRYTEPDLLQVKLIKFGRELGIGLAGLRELIEHGLECPHPDYRSCPDAVALAGQPVLAG